MTGEEREMLEWQACMLAGINHLARPMVDCHRDRRDRVLKALYTRPAERDEARLMEAYGRAFDQYHDDLERILREAFPVDPEYPN